MLANICQERLVLIACTNAKVVHQDPSVLPAILQTIDNYLRIDVLQKVGITMMVAIHLLLLVLLLVSLAHLPLPV